MIGDRLIINVICLLILVLNYSYSQSPENKTIILSPSFDTMLPSNSFQSYGVSIASELLFSKDLGVMFEYSKTHYYGSDKSGLFNNTDLFLSGPGLLFSFHINIASNLEMYGAIGASYHKAKGTFGTISVLFLIDENKWIIIPAGKAGFRWWVANQYALRIGYSFLRPISIGVDYAL